MTSEEMTTGSVSATEGERKWAAERSRWWNSTGGGTNARSVPGVVSGKGIGAIKAGDGGAKFKLEWPELDEENWRYMKENRVNPMNGDRMPDPNAPKAADCAGDVTALRRRPTGSGAGIGAVVEGGQVAREVGQSWIGRHKVVTGLLLLFTWVLASRVFGPSEVSR
jgi:ubiquitin-conjugating enzyme E2 J2